MPPFEKGLFQFLPCKMMISHGGVFNTARTDVLLMCCYGSSLMLRWILLIFIVFGL